MSSELQGIDTGMVSCDGIVYASLGTAEYISRYVLPQLRLLQGLGNLFKAQIVYEHCTSHDKNHCKGTMPFAAYGIYLMSK